MTDLTILPPKIVLVWLSLATLSFLSFNFPFFFIVYVFKSVREDNHISKPKHPVLPKIYKSRPFLSTVL